VIQIAQTKAADMRAVKTKAPKPFVLSNARLILADRVVQNGWLACVDGRIAEIGEGAPPEAGQDLGGQLLTPGLVELHTDHLESHYVPRPGVYWDPLAAVISYDAQLATCGITTVLDSLRIWREEGLEAMSGEAVLLAGTVARARSGDLLRADHFLHLRCEVPMPHTVEEASELIDRDDVRLLSLMDHTPGQRQFRDEEKLRAYYRGKTGGRTDAELDALLDRRRKYAALHAGPNYSRLVEMAQARRLPLASHDDTTLDHVRQSIADGVALAEFPTTVEAAHALHDGAVKVLMGAPNLVRGGSHSGNVSTAELANTGVLDILSSDYVPASLLLAALRLPDVVSGFTLPAAFATVSRTPAEAVGLTDRGEIAVGKRADLLHIQIAGTMPVIRSVWRCGRRVA
jgi:alpha-D-ribose 1-methylphosphonate 5-triphosphate diphosphatase